MAQMASGTTLSSGTQPWWKEVTWYHLMVVIIASCGWLFDCMDQRIFVLTREPALREVLDTVPYTQAVEAARVARARADAAASAGAADATDAKEAAQAAEAVADGIVKSWGGWATMVMMIAWATGGIIFGMMSDRWGRVKTMVVTLLIYSGFTGLSGIAHSGYEFLLYRFMVGLGVGGMFGAATTLVAESVPGRLRTIALGSLQTLSACGNMIGSLLSTQIRPSQANFWHSMTGWRILFFVGVLPALLVIPMIFILREPERWKEAKRRAAEGLDQDKRFGSIPDLLHHPVWRRNLLVGVGLGLAGMAGLWGIGFFSPELISTALKGEPQNVIDIVRGYGTFLQDVGCFFGMLTFTILATVLGRRVTFAGAFTMCLVVTIYVFNSLRSGTDAYWMLPMMGFAHLSVFAGYSIYFPEIFPTRLRGTGVGFCYNTVRYLAAGFPPMLMMLNNQLTQHNVSDPFRKAATALSFIFLLGLITLIWAPETKGKPLPED